MSFPRFLSALKLSLLCGGCVFYVAIPNVYAVSEQKGDSVEFSFTGTLHAMTPCSISNDRIIEVPFYSVGINKVESGLYNQPIEYDLDCGGVGAANTILMTIKATPVSADESVIASGRKGLWIQFYKDGVALKLNQEFKIDNALNPPEIKVYLRKNPNEELEGGSFSTTVTLMSEYL